MVVRTSASAVPWIEAKPYASFIAQQSWVNQSKVAAMKTPRQGFAAVAVAEEIIVIGGYNSADGVLSCVESIISPIHRDVKKDSRALACLTTKFLGKAKRKRAWFGAAVTPPDASISGNSDYDGSHQLVIAGGFTESYGCSAAAEVEMMDCHSRTYTTLRHMSLRRVGCCAAVLLPSSSTPARDGVYVVGGRDGRIIHDTVEYLPFSTRDASNGSNETWEGNSAPSWQLLPSKMKQGRRDCAAVVVEGRSPMDATTSHSSTPQLVVLGGCNESGHPTNAVEGYDFETGQWYKLPSMKEKRSECAAVAVGHRIYVMGGYNWRNGTLASVEYFDFGTQEWTLLPNPMSKCRWGCAAVVVEGHIVVLGGFDGSNYLKCVESLKVADGSTPLPQKKREGTAATPRTTVSAREGKGAPSRSTAPNKPMTDGRHKIHLPDLPPRIKNNAGGEGNRVETIQALQEWCCTVNEMLAKVELEIDGQMKEFEKTKCDELHVAHERCKEDINTAEKNHEKKLKAAKEEYEKELKESKVTLEVETNAAEEKRKEETRASEEIYNANMESLTSSTNDWLTMARSSLTVAQDEMDTLAKDSTARENTNVNVEEPGEYIQVFLRDVGGNRLPLKIPRGDYAALKRLAGAELNVSPDAIVKFRRDSDGSAVKSDRHMASLNKNDELVVVMNKKQ